MTMGDFDPIRGTLRVLGLGGVAAGLALCLAPAAAQEARSDVVPYLEVEQVLTADLNGGGDVLTYTSVAAGVDARISTRRVDGQISYRYERRIPWSDDLIDEDIHSGIAQVSAQVIPDALSLDAGAIAARSRVDQRGLAPGFDSVDSNNSAEVYGIYAGPTFSEKLGALDVNANYRFGYVKVDQDQRAAYVPPAGQPRLDRYDSATSHSAFASIGMSPGELPVGWTASAGYGREDTNRLDSRYEGKYARGDLVLPVSPNLAIAGGAGYEEIEISQQDVRRDAGGVPIVTPDGEFVADPSRPRLLAYDTSGLIWDAGVIWRPTRRTEFQARVGERYGGTTFTGSFEHKFNSSYAIRAFVYDSVDSFGRLLLNDLSGLPTNFNVGRNGLNSGFGGVGGGCVFGNDPGTGGCFDDVFQSINTANFRNRGANVILSGERGRWDFGLGAGYAQRKYLAPRSGTFFSLDGVKDEAASIQGNVGRQVGRDAEVNLDAYASWYGSGIAGSEDVYSTGVTGSYYRSFLLDRLQAQAALGIYTTEAGDYDSTIASALVGLRYQF